MSELDQQTALELFSYDATTGTIKWRNNTRNVRAGGVAGTIRNDGYRGIKLNGVNYPAHRLVWLITHGNWPIHVIDHINGIKDDNRICNLREATQRQNAHNRRKRSNSSSTLKGVTFCKQRGRWQAQIELDGKNVWLGRFDSEHDAHEAYCIAAAKYFGEFARVA